MDVAGERNVSVSTSRKLQALCSVASYPAPAAAVEVIETHFAWVFLVGEYAYKMKKPAAYPSLDLRSVADRHRNCLQEVRLNRRLAPEVYLDAVPLLLDERGQLKVYGEGNIVDWLVWMKRLPSGRMLDRAIADNAVPPAALAEVGSLLARFYDRQPRYFMPADHYLGRLVERTAMDGNELRAPELKLDLAVVNTAVAAVEAVLSSLRPELARRAVAGRIVECHGDLRPEHICLGPLCIIDSLEFSRELRVLDPVEELAFLRLECELAGASEVAERIIGACQRQAGDEFSRPLLDFYQSCRALVRAKILAWHVLDPTVASLASWADKAHAYLKLAERHARSALS
jgi:aminoglycoside phosphotransferase family enzyme